MDENPSFPKRMRNCLFIHWNGFFYFLSPLVLLPIALQEPLVENGALYVMALAALWYAVDCMPQAMTAFLPIIIYPLIGVIGSKDLCNSYCPDSEMVFMLSCIIAITMHKNKLDRLFTLPLMKLFGLSPLGFLPLVMILAFLLSTFMPNAIACSFVMPLVRAYLEIMEELGVCKAFDENYPLKDDEKPYPTRETIALYIGVAYAANLGGLTNLYANESGFELLYMYDDILFYSDAYVHLSLKNVLVFIPTSIITMLFCMLYLEIIYLGLLNFGENRTVYSTDKSTSDFKALYDAEKWGFTPELNMTLFILFIYIAALVAMLYHRITMKQHDVVMVKYSSLQMAICFLLFVIPISFDFCNYWICREPKAFKSSPSPLAWPIVNKLVPWDMFLVYGSSLAFGFVLKNSGLYRYLAKHLVTSKNVEQRQLGFMTYSVILTTIIANHLVTKCMNLLGAKSALLNKEDPSLFTVPIIIASNMSFIFPVSSVCNCFAAGWGNLRSKHFMLAGILPTIIGFALGYFFMYFVRLTTDYYNHPIMDEADQEILNKLDGIEDDVQDNLINYLYKYVRT